MTIQILGKDQGVRIEEIENIINKITTNKKKYCKFYDIWKYRSEEIKDEDRQLCSILHDNMENTMGDVDSNAWFESTSLDIHKDRKKLYEKYESFKVCAVYDESTIMIHGVKHECSKFLFEIRFKDKIMMEHFYFSIQKTLEANIAAESLKKLSEQAKILILRPNAPYKTASLMKK